LVGREYVLLVALDSDAPIAVGQMRREATNVLCCDAALSRLFGLCFCHSLVFSSLFGLASFAGFSLHPLGFSPIEGFRA
jgi:hypothetical protein